MPEVLIVDASKLSSSVLREAIQSTLGFATTWVRTYAEAEKLLLAEPARFFVCILDLDLPDALPPQILELVSSRAIPAIIFTLDLSEDLREMIWSKNVVGYALKDQPSCTEYLLSLVRRIQRNREIKVLVVDDSAMFRKVISGLMARHQYDILEASDGQEALALLEKHPDTKMVITDYNMPNMDGFELIRNIRERQDRHELSIIGVSAEESKEISAQFLKYGANDFLAKPFNHEEFYCRVTQSIELIENTNELHEAYERLKVSQLQMLQQEKMASVGQLAAGVAHEINNPMGFITSNIGTLKKYLDKLVEFVALQDRVLAELGATDKVRDDRRRLKIDYVVEDINDLINESADGASRVITIVKNLKTFSRIDQAEQQSVNMNDCLENTINVVWNELKYKSTVLREYGELPQTKCYPQQLSQVFMNLLVNAVQAIDKQGEIRLRTWAEAGAVCVAISDTGSGIPEKNLPRLFEPFFTTKETGKGTGLGLSIVYEIVKKHQGEIDVESKVGTGTTFTVRIPIAPEKQEPAF
ncbi:MAG: hypothetical protein A2521_08270 [Deltaproteobacteria bacterium RIFOXYD12_FULL_57_12]|nr:MAG: hypothetical protein A2521_08270 [Deltaproteobacteria bacterium RIFOXYD12_FULL_57_12]